MSEQRTEFARIGVRADYDRIRQAHQDQRLQGPAQSGRSRGSAGWRPSGPRSIFPSRRSPGYAESIVCHLRDLVPFIDWSPFFHTWELRGRYPVILADATVGPKAKELLADARGSYWKKSSSGDLLTARGVYGFFPANSTAMTSSCTGIRIGVRCSSTFHTLRQQTEKARGSVQPGAGGLCCAQRMRDGRTTSGHLW
jgi:5-methyltetrahydrofolate--homocysteine methyltransferase